MGKKVTVFTPVLSPRGMHYYANLGKWALIASALGEDPDDLDEPRAVGAGGPPPLDTALNAFGLIVAYSGSRPPTGSGVERVREALRDGPAPPELVALAARQPAVGDLLQAAMEPWEALRRPQSFAEPAELLAHWITGVLGEAEIVSHLQTIGSGVVLEPEVADPLEALFGPAPNSQETARAMLHNALRRDRLARQVSAVSLSLPDTLRILQLSRARAMTMVGKGELGAFKLGDRWKVPEWQLDLDNHTVRQGVAEILSAFSRSAVAATIWMLTPSVDLDDLRPIQVFDSGQTGRVVQLAAALTAAGW